jgi:hypothetical protein
MSVAERERRIEELFESAAIEAGVSEGNRHIRDLTGSTTIITISLEKDARKATVRFRISGDGVVYPLHPDGSDMAGIGNLDDEQPAKAAALRKEIARRFKEALGTK